MRVFCRFSNAIAVAALVAVVVPSITPLHSQSVSNSEANPRLQPLGADQALLAYIKAAERPFNEKETRRMLELAQMPLIKTEVQRKLLKERDKDRATARKYSQGGGDLYPNPIVREWINEIGQSLVPPHSKNTYAFRVIEDALPRSVASASGCIYITTGLLGMMGSEGQLAYILGHEIAHIERDHYFHRFMGQTVEAYLIHELNKKKGGLKGLIGRAAGGLVAASTKELLGEDRGNLLGASIMTAIAGPRFPTLTDWNQLQEEDADFYGLQLALQANYDVSDAVGVLMTFRRAIEEDPRIEAKLHLNAIPIEDRIEQVSRILKEDLKGLWEEKKLNLLGTTPRFHFMIAQVRRDSGIQALQEDLFALARRNLELAVAIRSDDAKAHYYLARVYTFATRQDLTRKAEHHFEEAIRWDADRRLLEEAHRDLAMLLIREDDPRHVPRIQKELRTYVRLFVQNNNFYRRDPDALPDSLPFIYEHLRLIGDPKWRLKDDIEAAVEEQQVAGTQEDLK